MVRRPTGNREGGCETFMIVILIPVPTVEIDHRGRTAVVTGAARGIGNAIASELAANGADVALFDISERTEEAAAAIRTEYDCEARGLQVDVSDRDAVDAGVEAVAEEMGPPEILVNNAAVTSNFATVVKMDPADWQRELDVNLTGAFNCSRACLDHMDGFGRIVNISSPAGKTGGHGQCAYAASKAGLLGLTKTIAIEHARYGVTSNAILPGLIESEAYENLDDEMIERILDTIPSGESGDPEDIAYMANFLASDLASYVNGAEFEVNAGQHLFTA